MDLDTPISLRQVLGVYNHYLAEEIKILWVLGKPEARKYAVKEPGLPVRFTNDPGELVHIKDGAYKARQRVASILYTLAAQNEDMAELADLAKRMGRVAHAQCAMVHKLDKQEMLERVKSLTPELYEEV
jgi:hypothetical protein